MDRTRSSEIGKETVKVTVDASLEKFADWLLGVLAKMAKDGLLLEDGKKFQVGWSAFTLRRQQDGALHVFEPDFLNDAFKAETPGATQSLQLQGVQMAFADQLGVTPESTAFQEKIVLEKNCLSAENVYMTRVQPQREKADSGWFIGVRQRSDSPQEFEAIYAYELLQRRPELFPALILPAGCVVTASKVGIETVMDASNKVVFDRRSIAV